MILSNSCLGFEALDEFCTLYTICNQPINRPGEQVQPLVVELRRKIEVFALRKVFSKLSDGDVERLEDTVRRLKIACKNEDLASEEHAAIVEAIRRKDRKAAIEALTANIQ